MQTFVWQSLLQLTFYRIFSFCRYYYVLSAPAESTKELCAWDAFLTQNVVDVFRVLRIALRVAILNKDNCHTSLEWSSHNGLKTVTQDNNSW